jgi:hypothetical protein
MRETSKREERTAILRNNKSLSFHSVSSFRITSKMGEEQDQINRRFTMIYNPLPTI